MLHGKCAGKKSFSCHIMPNAFRNARDLQSGSGYRLDGFTLIFGHPSVYVREVCTSLRIRAIRGDSGADITSRRSLQSLHCLSVRM